LKQGCWRLPGKLAACPVKPNFGCYVAKSDIRIPEFERKKMSRQKYLVPSIRMAFLMGSILALYSSLTTFWQMPLGWWLAFNNLLVVTSLGLALFLGYNQRKSKVSFGFMLLSVAVFFSVIMVLYLASYSVTTAFFADKMVWIPYFYRDYTYHGFKSVTEYLNHNNNFRELLELQIFSLLISSLMYFAAGSLGYGAHSLVDGMKKSSKTTPAAA
jgi:hypothetical protein